MQSPSTFDPAPTIEVERLTKTYGDKTVIDDLSFVVSPGNVTGFLGPNGSGKSTTMRLIVGLDHPRSGAATIGGRPYRELTRPLCTVGTLLDAEGVHHGRSAYNHLLYLCQTQGISRRRIDEVLDLVGLSDVKNERVGSFSLGMRKRLGIAAALLGDPAVLILDEPINGLDPDGIFWIRGLLKNMASEGRTVFVSSHLMSEMAVTADNLVVIDHGRLVAQCTTDEFVAGGAHTTVVVKSSAPLQLADAIGRDGGRIVSDDDGTLTVHGVTAHRVGELAEDAGIAVYELTPHTRSLEDAFMAITHTGVNLNSVIA